MKEALYIKVMNIRCYEIPLLPYFKEREAHEVVRASNARKHKNVKKIVHRFPSINNMYPINRRSGSKYLSTEGRLYKDYIYSKLLEADEEFGEILTTQYYEVSYICFMSHLMMFTKEGELREVDVSNILKSTEDAFFEYLLESDSRVLSTHIYKREALEPRLVILASPADFCEPIYHRGRIYSTANGRLL